MRNQSSILLKLSSTICLFSLLFLGFVKATNNEIILREGFRATDEICKNCKSTAAEKYYSMIDQLHNLGQKFFEDETEKHIEFVQIPDIESISQIEIICMMQDIEEGKNLKCTYTCSDESEGDNTEIVMWIEE